MTRVLALDQATTTGWCCAGTGIALSEWTCGHFRAPKRPFEGQRLIIIHDHVLVLIDDWKPDVVALEAPFDPTVQDMKAGIERPQFNRATMQFLQRVKAAVLMAAARRSIPTEEYQPRTWRATLKLPQRPPDADSKWLKQQTVAVIRRLGIAIKTNDEADAAGIAFHACHGKAGVKRAADDLFARARASL